MNLFSHSLRRSFCSSSRVLSRNPFLVDQGGQVGEITDAHLSFLNRVLLPPSSVRTNNKKGRKQAGVLLPLCNYEGEAAILFTKRTDLVGSHKGQVCFPGGKFDEEDGDTITTALRETDEELGLSTSIPQVLGVLPPAMSVTQLWVTTVVGFLGDSSQLKLHPNEDEIDSYFFLKLSELTDPEKQDEQLLSYPSLSSKHPAQFRSKRYLAGEWPVWGLTAHFVTEFLKILHLPASASACASPSHSAGASTSQSAS